MFGYDKISLSFSYHWMIFVLLIGLAIIFTVYSYRFTLPPIEIFKKIILSALRLVALVLLILIIFEPILFLRNKVEILPTHLIFIDNSKSISAAEEKENVNSSIENLLESKNLITNADLRYFTFGSDVNKLEKPGTEQINFSEKSTNLSKIFRLPEILKNENQKINPASITILTDGIITDGVNPIYQAEKLSLPVLVIAVGDSSRKKDILIKNVLYNENNYVGNPTSISATVSNSGYANNTIRVSLLEDTKIVESQNIRLNLDGINTVNFTYLPKEKGEKKLQIVSDIVGDESNKKNNVYPFYLNVTEDKTRIVIISGAPCSDMTFIKRALESDENYIVNSLTQLSQNKFIEDNYKTKIDSANILFMIGFPNKLTSEEIFNQIKNRILLKKTPFFLLLNNDVDLTKLKQIETELSVKLETSSDNYIKAQPDIDFSSAVKPDLINNIGESDWNKLPPVLFPANLASAKADSRVISYIKTETNRLKLPLMIQRSVASSRSICFVGKEFWRWKLQTSVDNVNLFDVLILNSARWLSVNDGNKQFKVKTLKKFYSATDEVEFVAEFYDELLNPINDGIIEVLIRKGEEVAGTIQLNNIGNGLYEGKLILNKAGDYKFSAKAKINNSILHTANGNFNLGDIDIEMTDLRMNYEFLSELSKRTNGEVFFPDEFDSYLNKIKEINSRASTVKTIESQIKLWSSEILLIIVIIFFSVEWFLRKQSGLS